MSEPKPLILCIDDDPDILDFLRTVLEGAGYAYAGAESAEEGLRVAHESPPDAVIVDLMMEEVDSGTGFVRQLRSEGSRVPMFMLSSVGDDLNAVTDYGALGLAGVFQKPLAAPYLLKVLEATLAAARPT
jgi:DNA-binding response OmpR family regulator